MEASKNVEGAVVTEVDTVIYMEDSDTLPELTVPRSEELVLGTGVQITPSKPHETTEFNAAGIKDTTNDVKLLKNKVDALTKENEELRTASDE